MLNVNVWMDCTDLVGMNTEEEVVKRGFQFTNIPGWKVFVGQLDVDALMKRKFLYRITFVLASERNQITHLFHADDGHRTKKMMFCKVGIGRAYVCDQVTAETNELPEGYDSFYLRDSLADNAEEEPNYTHEYYVRNPVQVLDLLLNEIR